jgi:hypothetical protein
MPIAKINVTDSALCFSGNQFRVNSISTLNPIGGKLNYHWRYEDYNAQKQKWESNGLSKLNSTQDSSIKQFTIDGYKRVWLRVNSTYGCSDSTFRQLHVIKDPIANFSQNSN